MQQDAGTGEDGNPRSTCCKVMEIRVIVTSEVHKGISASVYRKDTLIQSPITCASSSGENSTFPATKWHIQKHKKLHNNFDPKKVSAIGKLQNIIIFARITLLERMALSNQTHAKV